jgi:cytochrome c oxidase subunit 2
MRRVLILILLSALLLAACAKAPEADSDQVAMGKQLAQNNGCLACHSIDGTRLVGPSFKGVYGGEVELDDGSTQTADEAYLHESIIDPGAKRVKGYDAVDMPSFKLGETQVDALVAYIISLK